MFGLFGIKSIIFMLAMGREFRYAGKMGETGHEGKARSRAKELHDLLCSLFDEQDFQRFVHALSEDSESPNLQAELSGGWLSARCQRLIELVTRRGIVWKFFPMLVDEYPGRRADIRAVALRFGVDPDQPKPEPAKAPEARGMPRSLSTRFLGLHGMCAMTIVVVLMRGSASTPDLAPETPPTQPPIELEDTGEPPTQPEEAGHACDQPHLHAVSPGETVEIEARSTRSSGRAERLRFPVTLDCAVVARHIFLEHWMKTDEYQREMYEVSKFELCTTGQCFGAGTTMASLEQSIHAGDPVTVLNRPESGPTTEPARPTIAAIPSSLPPGGSPSGNWHNQAGLFDLDSSVRLFTFVQIDNIKYTLADKSAQCMQGMPANVLSCAGWGDACARLDSLPDEIGAGEFTLAVSLHFRQPSPTRIVAEPYSDERWWHADQRILDGQYAGFALTSTPRGTLRWLIGDGADIGPGGMWSIEAEGDRPDGSLSLGWHRVALVRRWGDDRDASLEVWIDGQLAGVEFSSSRADLRDRWIDGDGGLHLPWFWYADGDLADAWVWNTARPEEELEAMKPCKAHPQGG